MTTTFGGKNYSANVCSVASKTFCSDKLGQRADGDVRSLDAPLAGERVCCLIGARKMRWVPAAMPVLLGGSRLDEEVQPISLGRLKAGPEGVSPLASGRMQKGW